MEFLRLEVKQLTRLQETRAPGGMGWSQVGYTACLSWQEVGTRVPVELLQPRSSMLLVIPLHRQQGDEFGALTHERAILVIISTRRRLQEAGTGYGLSSQDMKMPVR